MNKNQLINEIINLCDENEKLKIELKTKNNSKGSLAKNVTETEKEKTISNLNNIAKQLLFKEVIYDWCLKDIKVLDKEHNFLTFEQWLKSIILSDVLARDYYYILDSISGQDFKEYFINEFETYYNKLVDKKIMEIESKVNREESKR